MRSRSFLLFASAAVALASLTVYPAMGQKSRPHARAAAAASGTRWVASWGASPFGVAGKKTLNEETTVRNIVHLSLGGSAVRIVVSNEFGTDPLVLTAATLAMDAGNGALQPGTVHAATFHGTASITVPAGAMVVSDPVEWTVPAFATLSVSLLLPAQKTEIVTQHSSSRATNYAATGNQVNAVTLTGAEKVVPWRFLKNVDVLAPTDAATVVTLGDSITDGAASTVDANNRWPDDLARRLQADPRFRHLAVDNQGIGGNRILHDGAGPNALARFDRDVIAQPGVKYLIILESINDIGRTAMPRDPDDKITSAQLIAAMQQMIDRAHAHGIKVFGATLTPYEGAKYASPEGQVMRDEVNAFIRDSGKFDGVVDFDKATHQAASPHSFIEADQSGDHLHPNDTGYKVMADSIDLSLFAK